jgi:hypothetical protein
MVILFLKNLFTNPGRWGDRLQSLKLRGPVVARGFARVRAEHGVQVPMVAIFDSPMEPDCPSYFLYVGQI